MHTFDFVRGFFHDNQSTFNIQCIRLTLFVDFFMTTNRHSIFNAYMIKEFTFDFVRGFFHDNQSTFNIQCILNHDSHFEKFFQTHFHHSTRESTFNIQCIYD